jgi:hypothetical protein
LASELSVIFAANPDRIDDWAKTIDTLPGNARKTCWTAMRWADTDATRKAISARAEARPLLDQPVPNFAAIERPTPDDLDACWGSFFGSGDARFVEAVIRCAVAPVENELNATVTRGAARWSLGSLCEQDKRIHEITLHFRDNTATPAERAEIDAILHPPATTQPG